MRRVKKYCTATSHALMANVSSPSVYGVSCSTTNGMLEIGDEPRLHLMTNTTPNDIMGRPMRNNIKRVRNDTVSTPVKWMPKQEEVRASDNIDTFIIPYV